MEDLEYLSTINECKALIQSQRETIIKLEITVSELREEITILKSNKNSTNSSLPPSSDIKPVRTKSLRESQGKKSGGQKGHEGKTLQAVEIPDEVIKHIPSFCNDCGASLEYSAAILVEKRQVFDIPQIKVFVREHQLYEKRCSCGKCVKDQFPNYVSSTVQYGPNTESLIAYLSVRQYMPFQRITECLNDVFQIPISQGSINNMLDRFAKKATSSYDRIRENIFSSKVVGGDESGIRINGALAWMHTWQDCLNTYLVPSYFRGSNAQKEHFPQGFPSATFVSDAWAPQLKTPALSHQLCIAHLLRDLNYFIDTWQDDWAIEVKKFFQDALNLKKSLTSEQYQNNIQRDELEKNLTELLSKSTETKNKKIKAFHKRLLKHKKYLLNFLYREVVPPDNNASERAIRNVKVKQKVSGQFKTFRGAEIFAIIRSVIDTISKRKLNIWKGLAQIAIFIPE